VRIPIQLGNGQAMDLDDPDPELFEIGMIARSLSMQCRYTGHTRRFYSVAEHCVLVSTLLPPRLKLWGVLHDAAEAFVGDMHAPLKHTPEMEPYRRIESVIEHRILRHFQVPLGDRSYDDADRVKEADLIACATEVEQLMTPGPYWDQVQMPPPVTPYWQLGLDPSAAESAFLDVFERAS
jgi:5'-deoxynucleotidase YfbR-like HD superfamily hydrolase